MRWFEVLEEHQGGGRVCFLDVGDFYSNYG